MAKPPKRRRRSERQKERKRARRAAAALREEREQRAEEWKMFRKDHLFTQKRLAGIVGISRRTIQQIEAARITPHPGTLSLFLAFKQKHEDNARSLLE